LSILVLASLSVGITAWLHPTVFTVDRDELAQRWASLIAQSTATVSPPVAPPAAVAPTATVEPLPVPAAAALESATAVPVEPPGVAAETPTPAAVVGIIEPTAEALAEQAWINAMPAGSLVVQHAAMPTYQAAATWKKGIPALAEARIVAVYRPKQKLAYFVVLSGPYTTRVLANESNDVRGKPAGAWVRTARSIRDQFNTEPVVAGQPQETTR
jgi:hypothetical protein